MGQVVPAVLQVVMTVLLWEWLMQTHWLGVPSAEVRVGP
jgi:hypothetical protein